MSKKNRRTPRRVAAREVASLPTTGTETVAETGSRPVSPWRSQSAKVDLNQEYRYVFTDLRKIGVIAVAMFALLFVLAFVLK